MISEEAVKLRLDLEEAFDGLDARLKAEEERQRNVRWGGYLRRTCAFLIDTVVLFAFWLALSYLGYVGYRVGLAASGRPFLLPDLLSLLRLFMGSGVFLAAGYFVLLHGMGGTTVGKWVLGLRVVAAERHPITYGQAMVRWLGCFVSAFFGLGFFWILLHRERRGWHDLLAGTWVIREGRAAGVAQS